MRARACVCVRARRAADAAALGRRRALERELEWIRKNPKAGRGKSKARVKTVAKLQQVGRACVACWWVCALTRWRAGREER